MQQHPMHLGGEALCPPPQPPSSFFIFKDDSSHRHTSSHKNKEKNGRTEQDMQHEQMQQHPMQHLGGEGATPSSFFIFKDDSSHRHTSLPRTARRNKKPKK